MAKQLYQQGHRVRIEIAMKTKTKRQAKVPQRRASASAITPVAGITFRVNILAEDSGKAFFLQAGQPSPWVRLEDVPPKLQAHIGSPEDAVITSNEIQRVVPRARLEQEDEILEELNNGHLDPEVRKALDARGEEHLATVRARNLALEEAATREDIAHDQLVAEVEAENEETYKRLGSML
jgi:hypothetical protein